MLAAVRAGQVIYVTEGEKDADRLIDEGYAATCNAGGAGKWTGSYSQSLRGAARVRIIADADEPGRRHARDVAASLERAGVHAVILQSGQRKDVSDHLDAGLGLEDLVELPTAQPLAAVLQQVEEFLARYVVFPTPDAHRLAVALWIAHTYVFDRFDATPYLAVTSPDKRCGKSRLLDCLELLVARPWRVVLPSESVVFRKIERDQATLLLDEVDAIYTGRGSEHEGLRAILNAGNRRGTKVPRCVGPQFELRAFNVFAPKALRSRNRKGYERAAFEDAWARYMAHPPAPGARGPKQRNNQAESGTYGDGEEGDVSVEDARNPLIPDDCFEVSDVSAALQEEAEVAPAQGEVHEDPWRPIDPLLDFE